MHVMLVLHTLLPWWKWPWLLALGFLLYQRKVLFYHHIHSRYAPGEQLIICTAEDAKDNEGECIGDEVHGLMSKGPVLNCTPTDTWPGMRARTADGTCNNLKEPATGARFYRFARNVHPDHHFQAPRTYDVMDPNPRTVARKLLERTEFKPATTLNSLAAAWLQFNVHDWLHHGENEVDDPPHLIPIAVDDPLRNGDFADGKLRVLRSRRDRTRKTASDKLVTGTNNVTHWWDASTIYGSTQRVEDKVRSFKDGKLLLDEKGHLPVAFDGIEITGFNDNWWTGLSIMHTLFSKEHNAVCDMLKAAHPDMGDQRLFETARLINAAIIAKIHTIEWTPALLSLPAVKLGLNMNWNGFFGPNIKKIFGRFGRDLFSGIPGWTANDHGVPYALTEEFTAIYRMHPLLRDEYDMARVESQGKPVGKVSLLDMTFERHLKVLQNYSHEDLLLTFGTNMPGALTLHNFPKTIMDLTKPNKVRLDLATIDILRDRERQVPRFNHYRRSMNLVPYKSIDELAPDPEARKLLKEVYDDDVEKVDLLIGGLAEQFPDQYAFSDTIFQAFIVVATRRLLCDRFYTDDYSAEYYTEEGLDWIHDADFRTVILRHHPALKPALDTVPRDNAFAPWKWAGDAGTNCRKVSDCTSNKCGWTSWLGTTCL